MADEKLRVLLVEDDDFDQKRVAELLRQTEHPSVVLELVSKLGPALERISAGKLDAVLLDVNLPDSAGLATVRAALSRAVGVPVVVLTGDDDTDLALDAMRVGAQDYVPKASLESGLLQRVLVHAVERQRLLNDLSKRYAAWTTVVRSLRTLESGEALQKTNPATFREVVAVYSGMLERTAEGMPSGEAHRATVSELARRMTAARAGVSDLLDVHLAALGRRIELESQAGRTREQEQLLILELMGNMVSSYRVIAIKASADRAPTAPQRCNKQLDCEGTRTVWRRPPAGRM